ncbi:phosphorylase family protein [Microbacterium gubbeenense]|uniref:phosphorylase family protein n=1 Tax=Microbacterium gubbeenense TaxID=159896 RepID=UPI00055D84EF|nr:phosphorylase [Microbacterium gubbeenense]
MSQGRSAADPWLDGRPPHIPSDGSPLPGVCLLPGDPARVAMAAALLDDFEVLGTRREFTLGIGRYGPTPVAICSTGIGGPSTEIAVVELRRLGVHTFIRVGGMGTTNPEIAPGTITTVTRAFREGGAAKFYNPSNTPIAADPAVAAAIARAATAHDEHVVPISVLSCDSYYLGEGRPLPGFEAVAVERLEAVARLGADAMDMECETVFAVAHALGARYGALLATHGSRATNAWLEDYEPVQLRLLTVALEAAAALTD